MTSPLWRGIVFFLVSLLAFFFPAVALAQDATAAPPFQGPEDIAGMTITAAMAVVMALQNTGMLRTARGGETVTSSPEAERLKAIESKLDNLVELSRDTNRILREPDRNGIGSASMKEELGRAADTMEKVSAAVQAHTAALLRREL